MIDLRERLADDLEKVAKENGMELFQELNGTGENVAVVSEPGSKLVELFFDGGALKEYLFTVTGKSSNQQKAFEACAVISERIENDFGGELESENDSFEYCKAEITSEPYFRSVDDDSFIFSMAVTVTVEV